MIDTLKMDCYCLKFLVGISNNESNEELVLMAVKRAYSDMARRTLFFSNKIYKGSTTESEKNIDQLKQVLAKELGIKFNEIVEKLIKAEDNDRKEAYDKWHNEACNKIIEIFTTCYLGQKEPPLKSSDVLLEDANTDEEKAAARKAGFSYGQAQKLLNMFIKYLYIFCRYYEALGKNEYIQYAKDFETMVIPVLHTPVDRYVIDNAHKKKYLSLYIPELSWSQMDYDTYINYQNTLRTKLEKRYKDNLEEYPFMWELINYPFK